MLRAMLHSGAAKMICVPSAAMKTLRTRSDPVISGRRPMRSLRLPAHAFAIDCARFATSATTPYSQAGNPRVSTM
jgi:hypothetical protein